MADFYKAFESIDEDGSGEITVEELQQYMTKNNYKESFVTKWLTLFDGDHCGKITYQHYCDTLGLIPRDRPVVAKEQEEKKDTLERKSTPECSAMKAVKGKAPQENKTKPVKASGIKKDEDAMETTPTNTETTKVALDTKGGEARNGRSPKSYPIQVKKRAARNRKTLFSSHKRNLRSSIAPGVILILLAGQHRGKRVVFLKQLQSGLLLVTGPFKLNGCPLRRVHQQMVIATKTRIDLHDLKVPDNINDLYFKKEKDEKPTKADLSTMFVKTKKEYVLKDERKKDQMEVDKELLKTIRDREDGSVMLKYLKSLFSLSSHDCPHAMQF